MCGVSYENLMKIDALELEYTQNMYWLSSFHQYCTALLNAVNNSAAVTMMTQQSSLLTEGLLIMVNSLERHCDNMSSFQSTNSQIAQMLYLFNNGGILPLCNITTSTTINTATSPLFYRHNPDLIIIPIINTSYTSSSSDNNSSSSSSSNSLIERKIAYSLLGDSYRVRIALLVMVLVGYCVIIPLLALIIMFIQFKKRDFLYTYNNHTVPIKEVVTVLSPRSVYGENNNNNSKSYFYKDENDIPLKDLSKNKNKKKKKNVRSINGIEVREMDINSIISLETSPYNSNDDDDEST